MRSSNKSRSRNKNNRNRNNNIGNVVNRVFDSNGPEGRVRGTPAQIIEKYQTLSQDAGLAGDRVAVENYAQHAEHYIRMLAAAQEEVAKEQARRQADHERRQAEQQARAEAEQEARDAAQPVDDAAPENAVSSEQTDAEEGKPKSRSRSKKPTKESFDEENAPNFLKAIPD